MAKIPLMKKLLKDPSVLLILLANLVPLWGVLFLGWSTYSVVWIYVLESFIIGFFNFWALLAVGVDFMKSGIKRTTGLQQMPPNIFMAFFFCMHYGMFVVVQALFVPLLFGIEKMRGPFAIFSPPKGYEGGPIAYMLNPTQNPDQYLTLLGLLISHTFAFAYYYIYKSGNMRVTTQQVMMQPYKRVFLQQVVIILGGLLSQVLGWGNAVILLFIGLKIVADLWSHNKSRAAQTKEVAQNI